LSRSPTLAFGAFSTITYANRSYHRQQNFIMAKMNHTPTATPEADQYDCALTEEDIYYQAT